MSYDSIKASIHEYLEVLDDLTQGGSHEYFGALYNDRPGAIDLTIRNIQYGLDHFQPGLVIDVGCGDGLQAYAFTKEGRQVYGVDHQPHRTDLARSASEKLGVEIEFHGGDATESIRGRRAGSLWLHRAIGHLKLTEFLPVAHEVLSPDGSLVFMTSNSRSRKLVPGVRRGQMDVSSLTDRLESCGFVVEHQRYQGYLSALPEPLLPKKRLVDIEDLLSKVPGLRAMGGSFSMTCRTV